MRYYYYYSKKNVCEWGFWVPFYDFTIIHCILVNPLKYEFKKIFGYLRIMSLRVFTHTKK